MIADECSVLGELLYIISNYEKGNCGNIHWWSIVQKHRLKQSLKVMTKTVSYLKSHDNGLLKIEVFKDALSYLKTYGSLLVSPVAKKRIIDAFCEHLAQTDQRPLVLSEGRADVVCRMSDILDSLKCVVLPHVRSNKRKEIFIYLSAFHNLPRALVTKTGNTTVGGIGSISAAQALNYADSRLCELCTHQ